MSVWSAWSSSRRGRTAVSTARPSRRTSWWSITNSTGTPHRGAGRAWRFRSSRLRSERGYGIGEFADLAPFAEWAAGCGLHLVQLLPVNDTSSDFTWRDSYPYKAISTAALHPIYLNVERVFQDCRVPLPDGYADAARRIEPSAAGGLRGSTQGKARLSARGSSAKGDKTALAGARSSTTSASRAHWLMPYAAFCRLRDLHGTADFTQWGEFASYPEQRIRAWFTAGAPGVRRR